MSLQTSRLAFKSISQGQCGTAHSCQQHFSIECHREPAAQSCLLPMAWNTAAGASSCPSATAVLPSSTPPLPFVLHLFSVHLQLLFCTGLYLQQFFSWSTSNLWLILWGTYFPLNIQFLFKRLLESYHQAEIVSIRCKFKKKIKTIEFIVQFYSGQKTVPRSILVHSCAPSYRTSGPQ